MTDVNFSNALDELQSGSSIKKAASASGITYSALYRYLQNEPDLNVTVMPPNGQLLYPEEEAFLKQYILKSAANGFPRSAEDICQAAGKIIAAYPRPLRRPLVNGKPTRHFVRRFMQRHPDLSFRKPSNVSVAGAFVSTESMQAWFSWFEQYLNQHGIVEYYASHPTHVWNCDETPLAANSKPTKALGLKESRRRYRVAQPNSKEQFTALITGNAAGQFLRPYLVLKGQRISPELRGSVPDNIDYTLEKEGYMTQCAFLGNFFNFSTCLVSYLLHFSSTYFFFE